jgi:hypothetical protein
MSLGFFVGGLLCVVAFAGVFAVLARAGALAKSKQLGALARVLRGDAGPRERTMLRGALVIGIIGACLLFMTVGRMDAAMRNECDVACREWGLHGGRIGRSRTSEAPRRACFCGPGAEAHQLYDITPEGRPSGPSTPPERPSAPRSPP